MAEVILLIGKLCCGKSTYAAKLAEEGAIVLSCDDLMQTIFPEPLGADYDKYAHRAFGYLYGLARKLYAKGQTVVLDFGYWTRASRDEAKAELAGCSVSWRMIDIDDAEWRRRIAARNAAIKAHTAERDDYYVDEGLLAKVNTMYAPPTEDEGLEIVRITTSGNIG